MNITIVGGGFGGVKTALELSKNSKNHITVISDKEDFQYYPALYGTATGHSHLQSWVSLGTVFAGKMNINVVIDTITKIDPTAKTLASTNGNTYEYDHLVLALGAVTTYFGIEGLDQYTFGIKSEEEIRELKHHLYQEIAEQREVEKQYVVIGGGPTGVELAAALGTYIKRLCERHKVPHGRVGVTLVEAAPRILPRMHPATSKKVTERLRSIGVKVQVNKKVESASSEGLMVNGKPLSSHTIIWTSGVANNPFFAANSEHFEIAKNGKVVVNDYLRTKDGIHVIGDNAFTPYSGLAQTALHDALFVSHNFGRWQTHKPLKKYKPVTPVVSIPVGKDWAVFEWHWIRFYGWLASVVRQAADFIGYRDILPFGQALGAWHAQKIVEEDYFTPTPKKK
ncbi:FAD-dependent oxidoreductase [Candidatus Saccharibacteria bacterium]|nr:FAD-dependent oxidoreductase [Candidatus Saccharibacteria bacterium]